MKMSAENTVVAVQASLVSWEGGRDICGNLWDGRMVVEHTLERVQCAFPRFKTLLLVPDLQENRPLLEVARRWNAQVIFGPFDDVVQRFCLISSEFEYALRLAGMHPFFSIPLAKDLLQTASTDPRLDLVLPPEDLDVQFTTQLVKLSTLRRLASQPCEPHLRTDPVRLMNSMGGRTRMLDGEYGQEVDRIELREAARQVYQEDVLHSRDAGGTGLERTKNSQIFAHYRLAMDQCRQSAGDALRNILDVGGALGFRQTLQERSTAPLKYTVVDIDSQKLVEGQKSDANTLYVQGDCYRLPFPDHNFDLVCAFEILEHIHDPAQLLIETMRVARPGGFVAVSTPQNRSGLLPLNPHHVQEFTLQQFSELCNDAGHDVAYFTFHSGCNIVPGLRVGNNMMAIFQKIGA